MKSFGGNCLVANCSVKKFLIATSFIAKILLALGLLSNRSSLASPIVALLLR